MVVLIKYSLREAFLRLLNHGEVAMELNIMIAGHSLTKFEPTNLIWFKTSVEMTLLLMSTKCLVAT